MINRILTGFYALLILIGVAAQPALAADEKKKEEPKSEKKAEKAEAASETVAEGTEKVEVSKAFLNRWKNIQKATSQKAYETQQTRTVAGVRGAEAEDRVLDQLYYKGGVRYPSRVDLKNAISQLRDAIKADPEAAAVPEQKFFIAQCHVQLGETAEALAVYQDIVASHADSDFAAQAKDEIKGLAAKKE